MLKDLQLNQPSVMKNSTGAGMLSKAANNVASAQEDEKIGGALSSQVLINAGKKVMYPQIDRSVNGSINRIGGIAGTSISEMNDAPGKDAQ